jgi:AraC family transcriptional regulator
LEAEFRSPLRVAALAAAVNVHPVYLCRAFRAAYGTTPGEYLRRLRIEWAERTLAHSDRPLAAIAAEAGFSDQSHFTREFRRHTGLTPARFRAHHRAL